MADATATISTQGLRATRQGELFHRSVPVDNSSAAQFANIEIIAVKNNAGRNGADIIATETRQAFLAKTPEVFGYDPGGNLLSDGRWSYTWDAENRLAAMETPASAATSGLPRLKLEFRYDTVGRRVAKTVSVWDGSAWSITTSRLFVYDEWNLLVELNALAVGLVMRHYVWGLGVASGTRRLGGAGGLLAVTHTATGSTHAVGYDGAANVALLVDCATGALSARYDYDPFGVPLSSDVALLDLNPFGFSTKYLDAETGLLYYGRRSYSPSLGRWISRDPTEEAGGANLYAAFANAPAQFFDELGERSQPYDWHHNYPQAFEAYFKKRKISINDAEFGVLLLWPDHQAFKNEYNEAWAEFSNSPEGKKADRACVIAHFNTLKNERFKEHYARSQKADVSYSKWGSMQPSAKLTLISPKLKKIATAAAAMGTIASIASGAEWLDAEDRGELMAELVTALEKDGADRVLEINIWASTHLPGIAKAITGKFVADLAGKPPLPRDVADRLREGFRAPPE